MIILAQMDPYIEKFLEQYGLPGLVILFLALMLRSQMNNNRSLTKRMDEADKREGKFIEQQQKDKNDLMDTIRRRDTRIEFLEKGLLSNQELLNIKIREEQNLRHAFDNYKQQAYEERQKLTESVAALQSRLDDILTINDRLGTENARLIEENQSYMEQVKQLVQQVQELNERVADLEQERAGRDATIHQLQTELAQRDQEVTALKNRLDKIDTKEIKEPTP